MKKNIVFILGLACPAAACDLAEEPADVEFTAGGNTCGAALVQTALSGAIEGPVQWSAQSMTDCYGIGADGVINFQMKNDKDTRAGLFFFVVSAKRGQTGAATGDMYIQDVNGTRYRNEQACSFNINQHQDFGGGRYAFNARVTCPALRGGQGQLRIKNTAFGGLYRAY